MNERCALDTSRGPSTEHFLFAGTQSRGWGHATGCTWGTEGTKHETGGTGARDRGRWGTRLGARNTRLGHRGHEAGGTGARDWGQWGYGTGSSSNWILMSCQPHWVTSGQSNSGHKQMGHWSTSLGARGMRVRRDWGHWGTRPEELGQGTGDTRARDWWHWGHETRGTRLGARRP